MGYFCQVNRFTSFKIEEIEANVFRIGLHQIVMEQFGLFAAIRAFEISELDNRDGRVGRSVRGIAGSDNVGSQRIEVGRDLVAPPQGIDQHLPIAISAGVDHVLPHLGKRLSLGERDLSHNLGLVVLVELIDFLRRGRLNIAVDFHFDKALLRDVLPGGLEGYQLVVDKGVQRLPQDRQARTVIGGLGLRLVGVQLCQIGRCGLENLLLGDDLTFDSGKGLGSCLGGCQ